jgi:hypothetical protein
MSVTVELPEDVAARLAVEAARRGITTSEVLVELTSQLPEVGGESPFRFAGIGHSGRSDIGRRHREIRAEATAALSAHDF